DHAKMSLEYVKKAEIEAHKKNREEGKSHIAGAIQHLVKAIEHAEMGHSRIAGEHIEDALLEMQQYVNP
nr:small metal-binding protein SmbP [Nitrosomonas sp.]